MAKKGRNRKHGKKEAEIERGFTVVGNDGKRIYLPAHPKGLPLADAEMLSKGTLVESHVVPIDQLTT